MTVTTLEESNVSPDVSDESLDKPENGRQWPPLILQRLQEYKSCVDKRGLPLKKRPKPDGFGKDPIEAAVGTSVGDLADALVEYLNGLSPKECEGWEDDLEATLKEMDNLVVEAEGEGGRKEKKKLLIHPKTFENVLLEKTRKKLKQTVEREVEEVRLGTSALLKE